MKRKYKIAGTTALIAGLVIGWNIQNNQVVNALLGTNTFVTRSTTGSNSNGGTINPSISNDGRYVVYESGATNLVASDTNGFNDIFLTDTVNHTTQIISVDASSNQSNNHSSDPVISGNGKYVVYISRATNLVSGYTNGVDDIFRYNISTSTTDRVSVDGTGNQSNGSSSDPDVDTEGRFVTYATSGTNLTSITDTNGSGDVILKDMSTGASTLISKSDTGTLSNSGAGNAKISCDGRFIAFWSLSSNLTTDTWNGWGNIFLTDMLGTQTVKNVTKSANQSTMSDADISCDGNYIGFTTRASNLGANPNTGFATYDAVRYNRQTNTFDGVSTKQNGSAPTDESYFQAISSDGRYLIFYSSSSSFVTASSDTNGGNDLFLRDMNGTGFRIISQNPSGVTGNAQTISLNSSGSAFSGTNRIVFTSPSTDLVSGISDTSPSDAFIVDVGTVGTCTF